MTTGRTRMQPVARQVPWSPAVDTLLVSLVALAVAGPGLGRPDALVFDEVFYVSDAAAHLDHGVGRGFQAHPPLGTWLVALGLLVGGETPVAWRAPSLALAVLAVAALHRLALRLLPVGPLRRPVAAAAALLLVVDGSWFVLGRTAMLDGPLTALVLLAVLAGTAAVDRADGSAASPGRWLGVGALVGLATAVKWSGALAVLVLVAVAAPAARRWPRRDVVRRGLAVLTAALVVYGLTWVPFAAQRGDMALASCPAEAAPCVDRGGLGGVLDQHVALVRYHTSVRFSDGYESPPSLWPLSYEPVTLHRDVCDVPTRPVPDPFTAEGSCPPSAVAGEDPLSYAGNPAVWLGFLALLPVLAAAARHGDGTALVAVAGWGLQWVPWLFATRSSFLFYMAPTVPFVALGAARAVSLLPRAPLVAVLVRGLAGAAIGGLLAAFPGIPPATAILGLAVGGATAPAGTGADADGRAARTGARLALGLAAVAGVTFVVLLPTWTASA